MPKFSVVIPVFNCERYVGKCIESLTRQNYTDYELIIVDDCSSDKSLEICHVFASKYSQIKIFTQQKNQGVSAARNVGLSNAVGKFLTFIDSDDFVAENYFDVLEDITKENFDLYAFGNYDYKVDGDKIIEQSVSGMNYGAFTATPSAAEWKRFIVKSFFASPCNKIYLTEIIKNNNLRFDESCVCFEDYIFNIKYCNYAESFKSVDTPLYYYRTAAVNHIVKRKWGDRFVISRKVAEANNNFIVSFANQREIRNIRRYTFTAYISELKAVDIFKKSELADALNEVVKDGEFRLAVSSIKPKGKYLRCLRLAFLFNLKSIAKKLIYGKVRSK